MLIPYKHLHFNPQSAGFGDDHTVQINKQAERDAQKLDESLNANRGPVVDWLVNLVADIKPEVCILFI